MCSYLFSQGFMGFLWVFMSRDVTKRPVIVKQKVYGALTLHAGTLQPRIRSRTNQRDVVDQLATSVFKESLFFLSQKPSFLIFTPFKVCAGAERILTESLRECFFLEKKTF